MFNEHCSFNSVKSTRRFSLIANKTMGNGLDLNRSHLVLISKTFSHHDNSSELLNDERFLIPLPGGYPK